MSFFEYWTIVLGLIFRFGAGGVFNAESNKLYFFVKLLVLSVSLMRAVFFFFARFGLLLKIFRNQITFMVFVIFSGITVFWNPNISLGFLNFLRNSDLILFLLYFVYRTEEKEAFDLLRRAFQFIIFFSFVLYLLNPPLAIWNNPNSESLRFNFRGLMATSAMFSNIVCILIMLNCAEVYSGEKRFFSIQSMIYFLMLIVFLFAASSVSSFLGLIFSFFAFWFLMKKKSKNFIVTFLDLGVRVLPVILISLYSFYGGLLEEFFHRDFSSLSGRTDIWNTVFQEIHGFFLIFGFGHNGLCISYEGVCEFIDNNALKFTGLAVHNDFLSVLLNYGLVGVSLFLLCSFFLYQRAFSLLKNQTTISSFYMFFLLFMIIVQISGNYYLEPLATLWPIYLIVYFLILHPRNEPSLVQIEESSFQEV